LRFRLHEDGSFTISLSAGGEREITGKDFKIPSQVELVTPDVHIATLTSKKSRLGIEGTVEAGFGYVPADEKTKEKVEVGTIALDAAFSPVRNVNYEVENMRVGDRTDYNRLRLVIETDGSLSPREAFTRASEILTDQFAALRGGFAEREVELDAEEPGKTGKEILPVGKGMEADAAFKIKIDDLKLSSRTLNALREDSIKTVGGLSRKRTSTLGEVKGIGEKGIQEVKKALGNLGITLKP
jgi:DNA-directed RNA polymerase subunit alpha